VQSPAEGTATVAGRPRRFAWRIAGIVALLFLLVVGSLLYVAQPQRATRLILDQLGRSLGLEITASAGEYQLRGTPTLSVRNVVAREPGAAKPLLRADRIFLSLPWSTIRARGSDLTVEKIELDRPVIDMDALQHWLQQRPPGETRIPTLTRGLRIRDGSLVAAGWMLSDVGLDLPTLAPRQRIAAHVTGRYHAETVQAPFALDVVFSAPSRQAAVGIAGDVSIVADTWRIPARIRLSGVLHLADRWRFDHARLGASARYESGRTRVPFVFGVAGTLGGIDGGLQLAPGGIAVRASNAIPTLDAHGTIAMADSLVFQLAGVLPAWPKTWPALPSPLHASPSPLPFELRYVGKTDLTDMTELRIDRDATRFDGRFHVPDIVAWIDTVDTGSPLPPLDGRVTAPSIEIAGAQLQGVELTLDDPGLEGAPVRQ
jgi:hypothetical protein